jgi:hypothetical protein
MAFHMRNPFLPLRHEVSTSVLSSGLILKMVLYYSSWPLHSLTVDVSMPEKRRRIQGRKSEGSSDGSLRSSTPVGICTPYLAAWELDDGFCVTVAHRALSASYRCSVR